ncbi:MAG: DUF3347 domain-containing protein [Ignavibacteria bacterium]|nr:DUF3347 domain-containing protein [Ignavibacteria bacterium]
MMIANIRRRKKQSEDVMGFLNFKTKINFFNLKNKIMMTPKKKSRILQMVIAILCFLMIGNKYASSQTDVAAKQNYHEIIYDHSKLAPEYSRQMVTDVFVDYMLLKNSLAKGNAADARFTTLTMIAVIADYSRSMDPKYLPDSKKFKKDMASLREKVQQSTTLDEARENFSILNDKFIEYIQSYGLYNKTIYLFQCNDNAAYGNGYWLSNSMTDTMNPYEDQNSGADCYKVKESWTFK